MLSDLLYFQKSTPSADKYRVAVFAETISKVNDFKQEWMLLDCVEIKVPCTVESANGMIISVENEEMRTRALLSF